MPHLEEQFPPVNPLVLQRPDALDPPDREEEEELRPVESRAEDETPLPGSLANGIDRVTISANARAIVPVTLTEEIVPVPVELMPGESKMNPEVPELLDLEIQRREVDGLDPADIEIPAGPGLQNFINELETRRSDEDLSTRTGLNPIAPSSTPISTLPSAPGPAPAVPRVQNTGREPGEATAPARIVVPEAPQISPVEQDEAVVPPDESRFVPFAPPPRGPLSVEPETIIITNPAEDAPAEITQGLRGTTPVPRDEGRVNIIAPSTGEEEPPGQAIQEARNFGEGRTLSLDLATAGNDDTFIVLDTVDEVLEQAGAILGPDTPEPRAEILLPAVAPFEANQAPATPTVSSQAITFGPALRDPADIPGPEGAQAAVSSLIDTQQAFEEDQETQALQTPAFPELDPDEPFIPELEPEARDVPAVVQEPPDDLPPAVENVENGVPVAPPVPGNVAALNENPQALRGDNLGTDPALRNNRELRNFLQEFNERIEPPEVVTEAEGAPVAEVQNNAPPPPAVFENLEIESAELLERVRERQATEGVTRPEEEHTAPPEPRTAESLLTQRGQNIDRFI